MSTVSNILLDKEILLESGTNELELLVFKVADCVFGINVAKVREVLPTPPITALPRAHPSIRGLFRLRNLVIPCVSLRDHLGITGEAAEPESSVILADFNQQQTAFLVDSVDRIHRLSWENILAVPGLTALSHTPATALARCDDRLVVMLDFEMILDDVTEHYYRMAEVGNPLGLPRGQLKILLAEDSPTVRDAIGTTLRASGYTQLAFFENGAQAWSWIESRLAESGRAEDVADLIISDVEMPQVDGFHLTRRIKQHPQLGQIPVLLYSSIVTPDNQKKGRAVGADAQVSKPELNKVVELADELIAHARGHDGAATPPPSTTIGQGEASQMVSRPQPRGAMPHGEAGPGSTASCGVAPASDVTVDPEELSAPPRGVEAQLWRTFKRELAVHVERLCAIVDREARGGPTEAIIHQALRTLHTIKSASMVIPLAPLSHCAHRLEGAVAAARQTPTAWPVSALAAFIDFLARLAAPHPDPDSLLPLADAILAEAASAQGNS